MKSRILGALIAVLLVACGVTNAASVAPRTEGEVQRPALPLEDYAQSDPLVFLDLDSDDSLLLLSRDGNSFDAVTAGFARMLAADEQLASRILQRVKDQVGYTPNGLIPLATHQEIRRAHAVLREVVRDLGIVEGLRSSVDVSLPGDGDFVGTHATYQSVVCTPCGAGQTPNSVGICRGRCTLGCWKSGTTCMRIDISR